jgi:hypothetical protein
MKGLGRRAGLDCQQRIGRISAKERTFVGVEMAEIR